MPTTNLIDRPTQQLSSTVTKGIFAETLAAMGGYALLRETLGIRASYLCRGLEGELIMRFQGSDQANKVKIALDEIDSYSMTFYCFSFALENRGCQVVAELEGVGRDQLQHCFEEFTGLSLVPKVVSSSHTTF
jgi:hypothetical protein